MMRVNRRSVTVGLLGLAMVGAVGVGGVAAAAPTTPATAAPAAVRSGGDGQFGSGYGMAEGARAPIAAAATYLGVTQADLQTQLRSGKSLADLATAQGRSVTGLQDVMVAAVKANLDANTTLTAAQKAARLALVRSEITTMVTAVHTPGDGLGMGTGMGSDEMGTGMGLSGDGNGDGVGGMGMHGRN